MVIRKHFQFNELTLITKEKKKQQKMAGRKMVMVTNLLLSSKLLIHFQRH